MLPPGKGRLNPSGTVTHACPEASPTPPHVLHAHASHSPATPNHTPPPVPASRQASVLDQRLILPKYGLAQISVLRGETTNAVSILESLLQEMPGWFDALRVRGRTRGPGLAGGPH